MKLISWNVNGLRACMTKGLWIFNEAGADIPLFADEASGGADRDEAAGL